MGRGPRYYGIDESGSLFEYPYHMVIVSNISEEPACIQKRSLKDEKRKSRGSGERMKMPTGEFYFVDIRPEMLDATGLKSREAAETNLRAGATAHLLKELGFDPATDIAVIDAFGKTSRLTSSVTNMLSRLYDRSIPEGAIRCAHKADETYPIVLAADINAYRLLGKTELFNDRSFPLTPAHIKDLTQYGKAGIQFNPRQRYLNADTGPW